MKKNLKAGFTLIELLVVIAIIGILSAVVLASLSTARNKANDAKVTGQLSSMRSAMEIYYSSNGNYGASAASDGCSATPAAAPWNDSSSGMLTLSDEDSYPTGGNSLLCTTSGSAWAASAPLPSQTSRWFCVDSTGAATTTSSVPNSATGPNVTCAID